MRVNLISQCSSSALPTSGAIPLSLTIRSAYDVPGEYVCPTDSKKLLRMLRNNTNLSSATLQRFQGDLLAVSRAWLFAVELSEELLTEIGYFID